MLVTIDGGCETPFRVHSITPNSRQASLVHLNDELSIGTYGWGELRPIPRDRLESEARAAIDRAKRFVDAMLYVN
jgi:hypothetical protein